MYKTNCISNALLTLLNLQLTLLNAFDSACFISPISNSGGSQVGVRSLLNPFSVSAICKGLLVSVMSATDGTSICDGSVVPVKCNTSSVHWAIDPNIFTPVACTTHMPTSSTTSTAATAKDLLTVHDRRRLGGWDLGGSSASSPYSSSSYSLMPTPSGVM